MRREIEEWPSGINEMAADIGIWRRSKGFETPNDIHTTEERDAMLGKLMLVVTEVAEAAEAVRKADLNNFIEELADTTIRIMDITDAMGIDLQEAITEKMNKNVNRPHLHGKMTSL